VGVFFSIQAYTMWALYLQAGWNCDDGSGVWCEFCEAWSYCIHW
jgi:hypothetical protein